nr:unnamed protein product [Spirometra erinaceieuropaei]
MFSAMLTDVYRYERPEIRIAYRTDGQLLNHRRMHFQSRVSTTAVHKLLIADDCVLNTTSEGDMHRSMNLFAAARDSCGLIINTEKPVVMHRAPLDNDYIAHQINANGAQLQVLPSTDTEAKMAGPDAERGFTGADKNPQHLCHAETAATALERPPRADERRAVAQTILLRKFRHGLPLARKPTPVLQGYHEDLPKEPTNRPDQLGEPRPGLTDLADSSEYWRRDLRSQPHYRRQGQTRSSTRTTPPDVPPSTSSSSSTPTINIDRTPESPLPSFPSSFSAFSSIALKSAAAAPAPSVTALNPNTPTKINLINTNTSDVDSAHFCPH